MNTSLNIEKLFLEYIRDMGETPGGFIGLLNPEILEEGDPKKLGRQIQIMASILENRIEDIDFEPWEYEKGKTRSRLKESLGVYSEMGKEIENMTEFEPKEYHLYVIAILIDIISSLFNHIESHASKENI